MKYHAGKALPGSEERAGNLKHDEIETALGVRIYPGTFNVVLDDDLVLDEPPITTQNYRFWPCRVCTSEMIQADELGFEAWIIRVLGESYPDHFAEVVSATHLRLSLKKTNWPAFPIEISLQPHQHALKSSERSTKLDSGGAKRVRNPAGRADSA